MQELFERIINDIRGVIELPEFQKACEKYGMNDVTALASAIRTKYMNGTKIIDGKIAPAIFNVKIYNDGQIPRKIEVPLGQVKNTTEIEDVSWNTLLIPTYMHASIILQTHGFKLTRTGITFDLSIEHIAFEKIERISRSPKRAIGKGSFFKPRKHDSDSEDDDAPRPMKNPRLSATNFK